MFQVFFIDQEYLNFKVGSIVILNLKSVVL
jgi:hypothetical protein